jgi:hypothetical protein
MAITIEEATRVYDLFVKDRSHVSEKQLEWVRNKLRKYCGISDHIVSEITSEKPICEGQQEAHPRQEPSDGREKL